VSSTYDERGTIRQTRYLDLGARELAVRVEIVKVGADGAASRAGLKTGDIILRYAGQKVSKDVPAGRLGITIRDRVGNGPAIPSQLPADLRWAPVQ
jgi:hypothetical protein